MRLLIRRIDEAAIAELRAAAAQGTPEAQYELGRCYLHGNGVRESRKQGVTWLRRAARQGHIDASVVLGGHLLYDGGPRQRAYARRLLAAAADSGCSADVAYDLAHHMRRRGDRDLAIDWLHKAAEQGHAGAQYDLGMHHLGLVVHDYTNTSTALDLLKAAAEKRRPDAAFMVGCCYAETGNVQAAVRWWIKAATEDENEDALAECRALRAMLADVALGDSDQ